MAMAGNASKLTGDRKGTRFVPKTAQERMAQYDALPKVLREGLANSHADYAVTGYMAEIERRKAAGNYDVRQLALDCAELERRACAQAQVALLTLTRGST